MMSRDPMQILNQFWTAFSTMDLPMAMDLFTEESTYEDLGARHFSRGLDEISAFWQSFFDNVPKRDYKPVRDNVFVAPDGHYGVEWTMQFRLEGSFGEVKGQGQIVRFRGSSIGRLADGHIAWQRDYWDTAAVIEQIKAGEPDAL